MPRRLAHILGVWAILGTTLSIFGASGALALGGADLSATPGCTTIDDFDNILIPEFCWDPGTFPAYGCWYDVVGVAWPQFELTDWGGTTAMAISDGGWTNGIYAIFPCVVPESGMYHVSVRMHVIEGTVVGGVMSYQIGVAVPGAHRGDGPLPPCPIYGNYKGLTFGNDTAAGPQIVRTNEFVAQAGQDVLIAFSTDVTSGNWSRNSSTWNSWNGTYVLVDDIELCAGPVQCPSCDEIGAVEPIGPLVAGATTVTVTGVNLGAAFVNVYVNGARTGRLDKQGSGGGDRVVPLDRPLARGDRVRATQSYLCDLTETEGCLLTREVVVGSGPSAGGIRLTLGLRETGTTAPIGGDGGTVGQIKLVGASTWLDGVPMGKLLVPSAQWQTISFDPRPGGDPVTDGSGNPSSVICPWPSKRVVLESLLIAPDPPSRNSGPYVFYVDDIVSGSTPVYAFETYPPGTQQVLFRCPCFLDQFATWLLKQPCASVIDDTYGAMGGQSLRVEFQFINEEPARWLRLTTYSSYGHPSPYVPNPVVYCDQPITLHVLLLPYDNDCDGMANHEDLCPATPPGALVEPTGCSPGDFNLDGDVDAADLLLFQACLNGAGEVQLPESCSVDADFDNDQDVDQSDFGLFQRYVTGEGPLATMGGP